MLSCKREGCGGLLHRHHAGPTADCNFALIQPTSSSSGGFLPSRLGDRDARTNFALIAPRPRCSRLRRLNELRAQVITDNEGLSPLRPPWGSRVFACVRSGSTREQSDWQNEESRNGWLPQHEVCMTAQEGRTWAGLLSADEGAQRRGKDSLFTVAVMNYPGTQRLFFFFITRASMGARSTVVRLQRQCRKAKPPVVTHILL